MDDPEKWATLVSAVKEFFLAFGLTEGVFVIFFFGAHFLLHRQYEGRLNDRQREIDNLAEENREYRTRFQSLLDNKLSPKAKV